MNPATDVAPLRHIIVVGGALEQWNAMSSDQWSARLNELGKVADHVGAQWLTLRPFSGDASESLPAGRSATVGSCLVRAQAQPDGRARVAAAIAALHDRGDDITEASIAGWLNSPADDDPDLVVVVGSGHRLPTSLVWELAYSELVFVNAAWRDLAAAHLEDAITSYSHRHRRFGGID